MNTHQRHLQILKRAEELVEESGIDVTVKSDISPIWKKLMQEFGCTKDTARGNAAKAVRRKRGRIVKQRQQEQREQREIIYLENARCYENVYWYDHEADSLRIIVRRHDLEAGHRWNWQERYIDTATGRKLSIHHGHKAAYVTEYSEAEALELLSEPWRRGKKGKKTS